MQYVRNISDSISTTWNSINPATLSGAIDVIVVEQEDGTLACSPFHVRFGKFSLLRPYEKKVEFRVNGATQEEYAMKLGEGGEAFFVFETADTIPQSLQTSPLVSPVSSPHLKPQGQRHGSALSLHEVESLDLNDPASKPRPRNMQRPPPTALLANGRDGMLTPRTSSPELSDGWSPQRPHSDDVIRRTVRKQTSELDLRESSGSIGSQRYSDRSRSPPPVAPAEAIQRAMTLSEELSAVNIPTHITETGDLMLDMTGFKNNDEDALRAELLARKVLSEELHGNYDVGALFGIDEQGNLWIYSSEEAKDAAELKRSSGGRPSPTLAVDAASDPGYNSDGTDAIGSRAVAHHRRAGSDVGHNKDLALQTPPRSPGSPAAGDPNRNYAKTLRLTSDQLKALSLKPGENSMSFTVNRATCSAFMYLWKHDVPVVISDIDGTITKSDALGHVMNMIGRDWTHAGVAKLYSDIVANGFNIMYLTSRSVGQSDMTRAYLAGILQGGYRLPRGPTILSPDRTMAALRREVYLRKPEVFKMSALRDIRTLYGNLDGRTPFYAGFGNRLTDQLSYRAVAVPQSRIFTINTNAEVSLDLLSLNRLKLSYVNMTEVVDHYFPPVATLVKGGGEEYTDFTYWRDTPLELDDFSASEADGEGGADQDEEYEEGEEDLEEEEDDVYDEDEEEDLAEDGGLGDSYIPRGSLDHEDDGSEGDDENDELDEDEEAELHVKRAEPGRRVDDAPGLNSTVQSQQQSRRQHQQQEAIAAEVDMAEQCTTTKPEILSGTGDESSTTVAPGDARPHHPASAKTSPPILAEDLNAELITGLKNLTIETEQHPQAAMLDP